MVLVGFISMSEGDILMAKAEKASSGGFLSKLFNGANNDEVADLYKDAGNAYKTSRSCMFFFTTF